MNKTRSAALALALLLTLGLWAMPLTAAADGEAEGAPEEEAVSILTETIYIRTAEDLTALAESCSLDTWSLDKIVVLERDISLEGVDFESVPSFGGVFRGNGHIISGLEITGKEAPAGLFAVVQAGAVIQDLNVTGTVAPEGSCQYVGGIAGRNNGLITGCSFAGVVYGSDSTGGVAGSNGVSGVIEDCAVAGVVAGTTMTGGVAGNNSGMILRCENAAAVNNESVDPSVSISDLDVDLALDLANLSSAINTMDISNAPMDTGGVAGYSSGTIGQCVNTGAVGYAHIGYNAGGIAGRSGGYILDCENKGVVSGRKDVGGVTGQAEPYIVTTLTASTLATLQEQLEQMGELMQRVQSDVEGMTDIAAARLNNMAGYLDSAGSSLSNLQVQVTGSGSAAGSAGASGTAGGEGGLSAGISADGLDVSGSLSLSHDDSGSAQASGSAAATVSTDLSGLYASLSGMSGQLRLLNQEMGGQGDELSGDMSEINSLYSQILDTCFSVTEEDVTDTISDTSELDIAAVTFGKVTLCRNSGTAEGDLNVGGIAGSLSIEYSVDPEDDVTQELSASEKKQYEMKAILQDCENTGAVAAKRDCVGGIVGRADIGLVTGCENYGPVESESGDYAGGIAGLNGSAVRNCWVKAAIRGNDYVGGVVGNGVEETVSGGGSTVSGCYSLTELDAQQYAGAISGSDGGTYESNYFVADALAGLNRVSYSGQAEPITYDELLAVEGLPSQFRTLKLTFVADDVTLKSSRFAYGSSFDQSVFPEIPEKEGYYARWDREELTNLHIDTTVTAVYTQYTSALECGDTRADGRAVFLAEGNFDEDGELLAVRADKPDRDISTLTDSFSDTVQAYFSDIGDGRWPSGSVNKEFLEQWTLTLPDDGLESHSVRYLPADGNSDGLRVYVRQDGKWVLADTRIVGSYLTFDVSGRTAEIAAVSTLPVWWVWLAAIVLILAVILIIVICALRGRAKRCRRKEERARQEQAKAEAVAAARQAAQEAAEQAERERQAMLEAARSDPDKDDNYRQLLERTLSAESRLARQEAELQILRASLPDAAPAAPEREQEEPPVPKKKKRRWPWIVLLCAAVIIGALAAVCVWKPALRDKAETLLYIRELTGRQELDMTLSVRGTLDGQDISLSADVWQTQAEEYAVTGVEQSGVTLYYADDALFLESGDAYEIGAAYPDYSQLLSMTDELFSGTEITSRRDGGYRVYTVTAGQRDAQALLEILWPGAADMIAITDGLEVSLLAEDGHIQAIAFEGGASLSGGSDLALEAQLTILWDSQAEHTVPQAVLDALASGQRAQAGTLTEDAFRLLTAWSELNGRDPLGASVSLSADCGPVALNTSLDWVRTEADGQTVNRVTLDGQYFYFTTKSICGASGNAVTAAEENAVRSVDLLEIVYEAFQRGGLTCEERGGGYVYELDLTNEEMEKAVHAAAPDTADYDIDYQDGVFTVTVRDGRVTELSFRCGGSAKVLIAKVSAAVDVTIQFKDPDNTGSITLPEAVKTTLGL